MHDARPKSIHHILTRHETQVPAAQLSTGVAYRSYALYFINGVQYDTLGQDASMSVVLCSAGATST